MAQTLAGLISLIDAQLAALPPQEDALDGKPDPYFLALNAIARSVIDAGGTFDDGMLSLGGISLRPAEGDEKTLRAWCDKARAA